MFARIVRLNEVLLSLFSVIKINNFHCDLTDVSAKTQTLRTLESVCGVSPSIESHSHS